jgi:predicted AAA+ superfamily ATPase
MLRISALSNKNIVEGKTVIFIDEIQEAKDAITPIKFLVQKAPYKFIFSDSLLGVKMKDVLSV